MKQKYLTTSFSQTKKIGKDIAQQILKINETHEIKNQPRKTATIIALEGELGSGKTIFTQGIAKGLGIKEKILSPSFVILKRFTLSSVAWQQFCQRQNYLTGFKNFYHIDCYRIKKPKEILGLGFKEIISNPKNIVVIEWAERVRKIMPNKTIWIKFKFINKNTRKIIVAKGQNE